MVWAGVPEQREFWFGQECQAKGVQQSHLSNWRAQWQQSRQSATAAAEQLACNRSRSLKESNNPNKTPAATAAKSNEVPSIQQSAAQGAHILQHTAEGAVARMG